VRAGLSQPIQRNFQKADTTTMIERIGEFPTLTIIRHPLVQHKLTILRDRDTPTKIFKELVDEIAMFMAYEATSDLPLEEAPVETPLERAMGRRVAGKKLTLVPILRAGLGMVEGIYRLVPGARVGHIGLYRDHDTLQPVDYYFKVPGDAAERARVELGGTQPAQLAHVANVIVAHHVCLALLGQILAGRQVHPHRELSQ